MKLWDIIKHRLVQYKRDPVTGRNRYSSGSESLPIGGPLSSLIAAVRGSDGSGVVPHPSVTAAITQEVNSSLPAGIITYPAGIVGSNATAETPGWSSVDVFSFVGATSFISYANVAGGSNRSYPLLAMPSYVVFGFSGRYLYLLTTWPSKRWQILLDGKSVGTYTTAVGTSNAFLKVDLGAIVHGEITVMGDNDAPLAAIGHAQEGSIIATSKGLTGWNISDSYGGHPCSAIATGASMYKHALMRCGVKITAVDQIGSTGYIRTNGAQNALQRLPKAIAAQPDVFWTVMGINDPLPNTYAELRVQIMTYYLQARAAMPDAVIITQPSFCPKESNAYTPGQNAQLVRQYVLEALDAIGGPWIFIDNITSGWLTSAGTAKVGTGKSWQTGDGKTGSPTGFGNGDFFVHTDGTHLNENVGTDFIERRLADSIRAAVLSMDL